MMCNEDYHSLVNGVGSLDLSGDAIPCKLLITGDTSFPVLVTPNKDVLIAAARYGKGKMVVLAHEAYLNKKEFMAFLQNAVSWLSPHSAAVIRVNSALNLLANTLKASGKDVQTGSLSHGLEVLCIDGYDDSKSQEIISFVHEGGGLLIGAQAWHWSYSHKENVLNHFPGNKISSVSGIYFFKNSGEKGKFLLTENVPDTPLFTNVDFSEDLKILLNGVSYLDINGEACPSHLLLHGVLTFPIGLTDKHGCFLGGAYYGKGRVVVISHEVLLCKPELKNVILNAISWLDIGQKKNIGVRTDMQNVKQVLDSGNVPCHLTNLVPGLSVYCCDSYSDSEVEAIHQFVAEGGGLLIGGQSWYWSSINLDDDVVCNYPGNKILNKFGITIMDTTVYRGRYKTISPKEANKQYHFFKVICNLQDELKSSDGLKPPLSTWLLKFKEDLPVFMRLPASPITSSTQNQFVETVNMFGPKVSKENPENINSRQDFIFWCANECCIVSQITDGSSIREPSFIFETDATNPEDQEAWRSTGLYLNPRTTAVFEFPPSVVRHGIQVQIGCQSNDLSSLEADLRAPVKVRRVKVFSQKISISWFFGGLLYIILKKNSNLGIFLIKVNGANPVPTFIKGKSSRESWLQRTRHLPAPWAELITDNIILTVRSDAIRSLDDPEALLSFWDKVMVAVAELAAIPTKFPRPERIVTSSLKTYMHSGYPILFLAGSVRELINLNFIKEEGFWGPILGLGQNQQLPNWKFTDEICALWPLYVHETVAGMTWDQANPSLMPKQRAERIQNYVHNGCKLRDWKSWTALETFLQLQEGFGWETYKRVFKKYQTITDVKGDNTFQMNLWVKTFSDAVETNLVPFFEEWGWPIDDSIRNDLSELPAWEKNAMKPYFPKKGK
ncbi:hypothetical protein GDO86_006086 [Hymenochirus boettgeri]|uniref:Peptidase M60 domain-containing protein n=1 Tax=Hymenochirus boettgeri TaxID=247094 RepID=A0A8T2JA19_9PIPI|nr:hypothetical protein GDO86_006086 [Hymenochirus boettgeri]